MIAILNLRCIVIINTYYISEANWMKKAKVLTLLLGSLFLVGCGETESASTNSGTGGSGTVVEQKKAFKLPAEIELVLGEKVDLSDYFNTEVIKDTSKVTIEVSDGDKVDLDDTTIEALEVTGEESVTVTLKYEEQEATADLIVVSAKTKLSKKLDESMKLESGKINSLDFSYTDTTSTRNTQHTIYNFYKNNQVSIDDSKKYCTWSLIDESTMIYTEQSHDSTSVSYKALTLVDDDSAVTKINRDEAHNRLVLPYIVTKSASNPLSIFGFADWTYNNYFKTTEHFGDDNLQADIEYDSRDNTYNLTTYRFPYFGATQGIRDELSLEFQDSGELTKISSTTSYYSNINNVSQIPEKSDGSESKVETVEAVATYNEKQEATDFPDYKEAMYKDYTPYFYDSTDYLGKKEITEGTVGMKISLDKKDCTPSSVSSNLDNIEIVKVEGEGEAIINSSKNSLTLDKAGDIVITTTTTLSKITKIVNFKIKNTGYSSITLDERTNSTSKYLPSKLITNQNYPLTAYYDGNTNTKPVITPSVVGENTANVTFTKKDDNQYILKATNEGKVTIQIVDSVLGEEKKIEKELTFFKDTDEGIASYLASIDEFDNANNVYSLKFTLDEANKTSGTVTFSTVGLSSDYDVTTTWSVTNKKLTVALPEDDETPASYIKSLSFYSSYPTTYYNILSITVATLGEDNTSVFFYTK